SSRRRHTRWPRDWSSDVCSSDLLLPVDPGRGRPFHLPHMAPPGAAGGCTVGTRVLLLCRCPSTFRTHSLCIRCVALLSSRSNHKIGRASCRERRETSVVCEVV